jgi:hypothetical protein
MHRLPLTSGKWFVDGGLAQIRLSDLASSERPRLTTVTTAPGSHLNHNGGWASSEWRLSDLTSSKSMTERRNNDLCKLL